MLMREPDTLGIEENLKLSIRGLRDGSFSPAGYAK